MNRKLLVVPVHLINKEAVDEAHRVLASAFPDFEVTPVGGPYIP